jgi:ATP-dependent helicase/DNAse subunit B
MSLQLFLGPANSAKAGEVLGAYGALAPRGAVLVVPTALDAEHYRRELASDGVVFGSVLTFSGLACEVARRTRYAAPTLSSIQRDQTLRGVLARLSLDALGPSSATPGFARAAGDLIAELERDLVTPQRFIAALRSWAADDDRRRAYADDLGTIYLAYIRELDRIGRVDRELFTWRALDALRARPVSWGHDEVFFYGFDELTALERDAVETLSRVVGTRVAVSLTYEPGRVALQARAEAMQELGALADSVVALPALDEHYAPGSRAGLHHLERHLFEPGAPRIDPGPVVALLESGGERAEAELVAVKVRELLHDGFKGEEIAVVSRSLSGAAPVLASVFAQYGIPFSGTRELPLTHTALGRGLRGALRSALVKDARPEDLIDYLRTPGALDRPDVADSLEARVHREGLRSVTAARALLQRDHPELDALAGATDPAAELCRLARELFAAGHRAGAAVLSSEESLDARALATLTRTAGDLAELGLNPSGAELAELLDELTISSGRSGGSGDVRLAEPLEIRARRFRAVLVCGLQEGTFPLPARAEPFLSDERRHELALSSGLRLRSSDDTLDRERYLFYATLSRATEQVVLSYRSSDEEGNVALPSPFIADVAELFVQDWPQRRDRRLLSDVVWSEARAPTAHELARTLAARKAPTHGEQPEPERILGAPALGRLRHVEIMSAGALETYADCPVKWLVERELQPEALEPEPEAITRGNLMHAALERVFAELDGPLTPETLSMARGILDSALAELVASGQAGLGVGHADVVGAGALRAIQADLHRYLRHEAGAGGGWRPWGLELRFGFDDDRPSLPALELEDGDEPILVRGAIDRVDVDDAGAAIVRDYKSGGSRTDYPAARWSTERKLQVALYLVAVRELTELKPTAGFYQPLRGDNLRPRGMFVRGTDVGCEAVSNDGREPAEFADALADATHRAGEIAAALRAGKLTPCPQTCTRDGCAFPGICRSQ